MRSSVEQIYGNMDLCDGQNVTLTGRVTSLEFPISAKGNKYTTFMLDDATATPLKVFSYFLTVWLTLRELFYKLKKREK